jgi:methyltransferase
MFIYNLVLVLIILTRLFELRLSNKNEVYLRSIGGTTHDSKLFFFMRIFHTLWFVSLFTEAYYFGFFPSLQKILGLSLLIILAQAIRLWTMRTLKEYWTASVTTIPYQPYIKSGPYKYLRHPVYMAVVVEFFAVPALFNCYRTLIVGSIINMIILGQRMAIENGLFSKDQT